MKKKALIIGAALFCLFSLTSCDVHFGRTHYDVPWWMIAIPVAVVSVIIFSVTGKYIASKEYVCPKCGEMFYPRLSEAMLSLHINDERYFKCPHCQKRSFCSVSYKSK